MNQSNFGMTGREGVFPRPQIAIEQFRNGRRSGRVKRDTMHKSVVTSFLLMLSLSGCADASRDVDNEAAAASTFDTFARQLYSEMSREPLDPEIETETGLFGDMTVSAGEAVVMGQYRYRVDSLAERHVGHMAFQIRDTERIYDPIPVVLRFVSRDGTWRLEEAAQAFSITTPTTDDRSSAEHDAANTRTDLLGQSVDMYLNPWVVSAVERLDAS